MPRSSFPYSEQILQWVWNECLFNTDDLFTECGKSVKILDTGVLNRSDGPDFKHSKILIGDIIWNGSVELHVHSSEWNQHRHHTDPNYENVFLHVVAEDNPKSVSTKSKSSPFTLNLLPYLHSDLELFLKGLHNSSKLPCSNNLKFINQEAFEEQISKAHQEYLDKKVTDFLTFYTPDISQSLAWKYALIISIFDGFGITNNRIAMRSLAYKILESPIDHYDHIQDHALKLAFDSSFPVKWNTKGVRPNSHPKKRIETASRFIRLILDTPFEEFLKESALDIWENWCLELRIAKAGHPKILFATVYLPALYFLGKLYHSNRLIDKVKDQWSSYQAPIPKILLSKFEELDLSTSFYEKKLGSIHQLKHYCNQRRCSECLVLKKVISS
jgi:hypothetical protein